MAVLSDYTDVRHYLKHTGDKWLGTDEDSTIGLGGIIHDDRYLEISAFDQRGPQLYWHVTVIDLRTHRSITLHGPFQRELTLQALEQVAER